MPLTKELVVLAQQQKKLIDAARVLHCRSTSVRVIFEEFEIEYPFKVYDKEPIEQVSLDDYINGKDILIEMIHEANIPEYRGCCRWG